VNEPQASPDGGAGEDGLPMSSGELEDARRRLYAPGATEQDRDRWRRLEIARQEELARHADAAQPAPPDEQGVTDPADAAGASSGTARGRARWPRRLTVVLGSLAAAAVVVVGVALQAPLTAAPERDPTAPAVPPPPLAGTTLLTLAGTVEPGTKAGTTVYWNSGTTSVDPGGAAIAVALTCVGAGRVTVTLQTGAGGETFPFTCTATRRTFLRVSAARHDEPFLVFAPTTGRVVWALRIVARPAAADAGRA